MANARLGKQAGGLLFALGIQALFALLLLWSLAPATQHQLAHEMILLLRPRARPLPPVTVIDASHNPAEPSALAIPQAPTVPDYKTPLVFAPRPIETQNPGLADCALENRRSLSAEAQASCLHQGMTAARPLRDADLMKPPPSHIKDEAHWQGEWNREHAPLELPCMGGLDVACLLETIASGHGGDMLDPACGPTIR